MKKALMIAGALVVLAGCALLMNVQDKAADNIGKGVSEYCKNTDAKFRADLEAAINKKSAPNSVAVTCKSSS